jgi:hypothetical protein
MIVMKAQIEPNTVLTIPIRRQVWTRRSLGMLCPDPVDPVLLPGVEGRRPIRRFGFMMGSVLGFALSLPRFEVLWNTERQTQSCHNAAYNVRSCRVVPFHPRTPIKTGRSKLPPSLTLRLAPSSCVVP